MRSIFDAAVSAAHPNRILAKFLPSPKGRLICLAAGKSAGAFAAAVEHYYLDGLQIDPSRIVGIATTRHGYGLPTRRIEIVEAGHPVPDELSAFGAARSLEMAASANSDDMVLALLSGGGSANWTLPVDGVSLEQMQRLNKDLLRSGAPISDMNVVRKHLSRIAGGRLARAAARSQLLTLAISDVPHDDPSTIASGPTVPDPSTLQDARDILARYVPQVDQSIKNALSDPKNESCKRDDPIFKTSSFKTIATPKDAIDAACSRARNAGYVVKVLGANIEGEARIVAAEHAQFVQKARASKQSLAFISGGELTVTVRGSGRGGPNQEYVLSMLSCLGDMKNVSMMAADTDGADGGGGDPKDPAGAFADESTFAKVRREGINLNAYLANNDATAFFERTGELAEKWPDVDQCQ